MIVDRLALKLVEQVEDNVGFPFRDGVADRNEGITNAKWPRFMAEFFEGGEDVAFGLDAMKV